MVRDILNLKNEINYQKGSIVSKTLIKNKNGTVTLFSFDKNEIISEHKAFFEVLITVLEGEAKITISGNEYFLKENESIIIKPNEPHSIFAIKPFKMLLIMIKEEKEEEK